MYKRQTVYRSLAIVTVAILVVVCTTGVILSTNAHPISAIDALFEATSAFGTEMCIRDRYGVAGAEPPQMEEQPVALAIYILSPKS